MLCRHIIRSTTIRPLSTLVSPAIISLVPASLVLVLVTLILVLVLDSSVAILVPLILIPIPSTPLAPRGKDVLLLEDAPLPAIFEIASFSYHVLLTNTQ